MRRIKIFLTKGKSQGSTLASAYCQALKKAGLINLNLIRLTSVLPHHSKIIYKKPKFSYQDYGKKIYVIIEEARTSKKGEVICVGLGWVEGKDASGYGIVIQSQGNNEKKLKNEIKNSLKEIIKNNPMKYKKKTNIVVEKITCKQKPVCALIALVFDKIEGWF